MRTKSSQPWCVPHGTALPPPPPGVRYVRLKWKGIIVADDGLRRRVERFFHYPMIAMAILVLPLLILDYRYVHESHVDPDFEPTRGWVWWLTITGLTLVWLAFFIEFLVKITIAECRIEYVKRNWLDIVIIVIPVLRPLRAAAVARTTRVFTLRGVGFKFARYVFTIIVGLEATERFLERVGLKTSSRGRDPEKMTRHELMTEVRRLRTRCGDWENWHKAEQHYIRVKGVQPFADPAPDSALANPTADNHPGAEHPLQSGPDADLPGATQPDGR